MRKITRRSFLAAAAACGAAAALSACGGSSASSAAASSVASSTAASASAAADGQKFTVGICQLVQHAALDAATQGFEDALTAAFGDNVTFDFQNAQGDSATCATIANGFVSSSVDLIMANATPALQAAQAATNTIPVLGTSVTEYGVALGLDNFKAIDNKGRFGPKVDCFAERCVIYFTSVKRRHNCIAVKRAPMRRPVAAARKYRGENL